MPVISLGFLNGESHESLSKCSIVVDFPKSLSKSIQPEKFKEQSSKWNSEAFAVHWFINGEIHFNSFD